MGVRLVREGILPFGAGPQSKGTGEGDSKGLSRRGLDGQHDDHAGGHAEWNGSKHQDQLAGFSLRAVHAGRWRHAGIPSEVKRDAHLTANEIRDTFHQ